MPGWQEPIAREPCCSRRGSRFSCQPPTIVEADSRWGGAGNVMDSVKRGRCQRNTLALGDERSEPVPQRPSVSSSALAPDKRRARCE